MSKAIKAIKAPFPYFGGKSVVAAEVWRRFGNVTNYIEPFAGSCAVLLGRPQPFRGVETINDADGLLANFWRAMTKYPRAVARWADWPVNEADLRARHLWLVGRREGLTSRLMADPDWCDPKAAGWWVWGAGAATPGNWCQTGGLGAKPRPGPRTGIHVKGASAIMEALASRIRRVRVLCGDWSRTVSSDSEMGLPWGGECGVFLDPPYSDGRDPSCYAVDSTTVYADVTRWALDNESARVRIAVCGHAGEHSALESCGWSAFRWSAHGGHGNKGRRGRANRHRECIWFSPACHNDPEQPSLF